MKYLFAFLVYLLITSKTNGQDLLCYSKEQIYEWYADEFSDDTTFVYDISENDSCLVVKITGIEFIQIEYFLDENDLCKKVILYYSCGPCYSKHKSDLFAERKLKWRKIEDNFYLSSWSWKRTLRIEDMTNGEFCGKVVYEHINSRSEYKRIKNLV